MEVMQWEALLKNGKKRCASTSTKSCWPAPVIKEGKSNEHVISCTFAKKHRTGRKKAVFFLPSLLGLFLLPAISFVSL